MTVLYAEIALVALLIASTLFVLGFVAGGHRSRLIVREARSEAKVAQSRIAMLERNEKRLAQQRLAFVIHDDIIQITPGSMTVGPLFSRRPISC